MKASDNNQHIDGSEALNSAEKPRNYWERPEYQTYAAERHEALEETGRAQVISTNKALRCLFGGDKLGAVPWLTKAIQATTDTEVAGYLRFLRASIYLSLNYLIEGVADLNEVLTVFPDSPDANYLLARTYHRLGVYWKTLDGYGQARSLDPAFKKAWFHLALVRLRLGKGTCFLTNLWQVIKPKSLTAEDYYSMGVKFLGQCSFCRAIKAFDKAVRLKPRYARAQLELGKACWKLGKYYEAAKNFSTAITSDPRLTEAYSMRAQVMLELREEYAAIEDLEAVIKLEPDNSDAYGELGFAFTGLWEFKYAFPCFRKALKLNPRDEEAYWNRSAAYALVGDYRRAKRDLRIARWLAHKQELESDSTD